MRCCPTVKNGSSCAVKHDGRNKSSALLMALKDLLRNAESLFIRKIAK
jgi:hypothetical protein